MLASCVFSDLPPNASCIEKFVHITQYCVIVNYFHNRIIVGNYCTFPARLTFGTVRIVPEILLPLNYNTVL